MLKGKDILSIPLTLKNHLSTGGVLVHELSWIIYISWRHRNIFDFKTVFAGCFVYQ
jgi:hypothetical protein